MIGISSGLYKGRVLRGGSECLDFFSYGNGGGEASPAAGTEAE